MYYQTARQLKLKNLPQFAEVPGGVAIETLAEQGNPKAFAFPHVLSQTANCHFSFAGIKFAAKQLIVSEETSQSKKQFENRGPDDNKVTTYLYIGYQILYLLPEICFKQL